jgi:hypothetical protein
MTGDVVLREAIPRVVVIEEALEDGDVDLARQVAFDLELDLSAAVVALDAEAPQ